MNEALKQIAREFVGDGKVRCVLTPKRGARGLALNAVAVSASAHRQPDSLATNALKIPNEWRGGMNVIDCQAKSTQPVVIR